MTVTLPYRFDTAAITKTILRGVLGLLVIVVAGIIYSLWLARRAAAIQLSLVGAFMAWFGRVVVLRYQERRAAA
ncbi:MAG TPA: hypothetical protein VFW66_10505 [Gemmatimonadales bacterium]|nr:hypothetical protein [Gemmatimonadales bacterium]